MEVVNGVSEGDKGAPPPPSPLTGCYLLIVIGEPHCSDHKDIILQRVAKGLLSWDVNECLVDLEKELAIITEQALEGEEARYGERLIQFASENLVTEILIHPVVSTLAQCVRNLLSSFTRHRHIIHSGYTFANNGSWVLQDGTFSLADFSEAFQELEVLRVIRAYENGISLDIHCSPEGEWTRLPKESFTKSCKVKVNPNDVLTSGSPSITSFINYIEPFLVPAELDNILESSDVVGNIRFSRPTLYVFPGGQGDAALFGINGFNMLLDGGFSRKACFWDFVRHLDRLDAVLLTRLNNSNVNGISAVLRRKKQNALYPQIGHFFCNIQERKAILSPDGDKDKDPLLINLLEEGQEIVTNLRHLSLTPQVCYRDSEPINLYHKVGHGTLDMYVLSPAKDSKEVREFLQKWNNNDQKLFANQKSRDFVFPLQNLVSICALLVWQPANPDDTITRILFPGSSPQNKIFEGLDKIKSLEFVKHPVCSEKSLAPASVIKSKAGILEKILPSERKVLDYKKPKPFEKTTDNALNESDLKNNDVNGVQPEKTVKKSDSTESEKSISKPKKVIENGDKSKYKKPEPKPKLRSDSQQRKIKSADKKPSPTTPKKSIEKQNEDTKDKPRPKSSPSATPAKSAKEANNRKVVESKIKTSTVSAKKEPPKPQTKTERKPISRRPKDLTKAVASPTKKVNGIQKPDSISRRGKLDKEGTTDSSTVSTPSADQDSMLKKDISKLTPDELQNLKAQELADLKEEQEAVKEIEAVFRKGELQQDKPSNFRKIKDLSIDDKLDSEEYLIIEKTEIDPDLRQEDGEIKEDETQKHTRDSEESEKQRKLSAEILKVEVVSQEKRHEIQDEVQKIITSATDIVKTKEEIVDMSKEVSATSPEDKIDLSTDKKITDKDNEDDIKEPAPESQPDEKGSGNAESGATTTAPTLPEDERIPLDEIKEHHADQAVEEKHVKEDTKEKDVPVIQLPQKMFENVTKLPPVVGIRLDKQSHIRDIVKTPDEVADLPVHEEVDIDHYDVYGVAPETKPEPKETDDVKQETAVEKDKAITEDECNKIEAETLVKEKELDGQEETMIKKAVEPTMGLMSPKLDKQDVGEKSPAIKIGDDQEEETVDLNKKEISKSPEEEKDTDEHELQNESPASTKDVYHEDDKKVEDAAKEEVLPKKEAPHDGVANIEITDKAAESAVKPPIETIEKEEIQGEAQPHEPSAIAVLNEESRIEATPIIDKSEEKIEIQEEEKSHQTFASTVSHEEGKIEPTTIIDKSEEKVEAHKEEKPHETLSTTVSNEGAIVQETAKIDKSDAKTQEDGKPHESFATVVLSEETKIQTSTIINKVEKKSTTQEEQKPQETSTTTVSSEEAKIEATLVIEKLEEKTKAREEEKSQETVTTAISKEESTPVIDKSEEKLEAQKEETSHKALVATVSNEEVKVQATPKIDKSEENANIQEEDKSHEPLATTVCHEEGNVDVLAKVDKSEVKGETQKEEKPGEVFATVASDEEAKMDAISEKGTETQTEAKRHETFATAVVSDEKEKINALSTFDKSEENANTQEEDKTATAVYDKAAKIEALPNIDQLEEKPKIQEEEKPSEALGITAKIEETANSEKLIDESSYTSIADDFDEDEFPEMPQYEEVTLGREMEKDTEKRSDASKHDEDQRIQIVKETGSGIANIDEKLQKLKDKAETQRRQSTHEVVTIDHKIQAPEHAEPVVITSDSKPDSPVIEEVLTLEEKMELGRKSPKEREGGVAKIVASVAVVLKSDAPLEEFEGKIPLLIPYKGYTTELRETHITTVDSPVTDEQKTIEPAVEEAICPKSITMSFLERERGIELIDEDESEAKISKIMKDSKELMQATSKMLSEIKQTPPIDVIKEEEEEVSTVHRMLVTASSEDGGEETEICPPGTIIFSKSSESSGRSSPDNLSQKVSQKSSTAETSSDATTIIKSVKDSKLEKDIVIDENIKEPETKIESKIEDLKSSKNTIDNLEPEDEKKSPKDQTIQDNEISHQVETTTPEVTEEQQKDKVQEKEEIGDIAKETEHEIKVAGTTEKAKDAQIRSKEDINEGIKLQMQEAKEVDTENKKRIADRHQGEENIKDTTNIEAVESKNKVTSEVKTELSEINDDLNKKISMKESKENVEAEKEEVIEKLDDGKDDLSKKSSKADVLDTKLSDTVKEVPCVEMNKTEEESTSGVHKSDKQIIEKSKDKEFGLLNGLEDVGEMVVDVVTADRTVLRSSPEPTSEQGRKQSLHLHERKDSGLVAKLEEDVERIVEKGVEEVKELVDRVEKAVFRKDSEQLQEEVLEKAAHDIEKNYDIVSDIAKSVAFIKCDHTLGEEEIKKEEQFLENTGRDVEENYEAVSDMTKSMIFEKCEKPEDLEVKREEAVLDKAAHDIEENYQIVSEMAKSVVFDKCDKPEKVEQKEDETLTDDVEKDITKSVVFEKRDEPVDNRQTSGHDIKETIEVDDKAAVDSVEKESLSSTSLPVSKDVEHDKQSLKSNDDTSFVHRIEDSVEKLLEDGVDEVKELVEHVVGSLFGRSNEEKGFEEVVDTVVDEFPPGAITKELSKDASEKHTIESIETESSKKISSELHVEATGGISDVIENNQVNLNGIETEAVGDLKLSGKSTPEIHSVDVDSGKLSSLDDNVPVNKETSMVSDVPNTEHGKKEPLLSGKSSPLLVSGATENDTCGKSPSEGGHELTSTEITASGKFSPSLLDGVKDEEIEEAGVATEEKTKSCEKLSATLSDKKRSSTPEVETEMKSNLNSSHVLQNEEDKKPEDEAEVKSRANKEDLYAQKHTEDVSSVDDKEVSGKLSPQGKASESGAEKDLQLSKSNTKTEVESSGKHSPLPQDVTSNDEGKFDALPQKSSTEIDDKKKAVTLSGKSTPDLENVIDSSTKDSTISDKSSSKPVVEEKSPTKATDHIENLSGKSSPDIKETVCKKVDITDKLLSGRSSPDSSGKISPASQQPGLFQKIENEIEKGFEAVTDLAKETKEAISSLIKDDSAMIEQEEKFLEKSAKDVEDNYEIVSDMSKSVLFEKCDQAEEKLIDKINSDKYEEILSKSAHDIEDNYDKVTDMTKSITFDKCDYSTSKEEKILEKSAHDIEDNFDKLSDMSKSIVFEKCETHHEEKLSQISGDDKAATDVKNEAETKLSVQMEHPEKKLSVSDVEISLGEVMTKSEIKLGESKEVEDHPTERKQSTEITASCLKEEIIKATETPLKPLDAAPGSSTTPKMPSLIVSKTAGEDLSGKSTPDIADVESSTLVTQETVEHEKHIAGISTPPTVPASPTVKEISSEELKVLKKTGLESTKEIDIRSATPGSDDYEIGLSTHSDISSGQVSRAPHFESERIESDDDEEVPGSPMSMTSQVAHSRSSSRYDFDEVKGDHMSTSFYGTLPGDDMKLDPDFDKTITTEQCQAEDGASAPSASYLYEITKAKYSTNSTLHCDNAYVDSKLDQINKNGHGKDDNIMTSSFIGELPSGSVKEPSDVWGKPLGLPSPAPPADNRGTPKKERKLPANVTAKNKLNDDKKRSESPSKYNKKKLAPVYVDLTYVPHHGNAYYSYLDFFKRVRARYYVFSGIEPSREVYNALLEAKQTWEDKELEVTIIPTYDTDILGYWVAENEELLTKYKIDLSPSASRCTINLQDHETSCSAYRLEF